MTHLLADHFWSTMLAIWGGFHIFLSITKFAVDALEWHYRKQVLVLDPDAVLEGDAQQGFAVTSKGTVISFARESIPAWKRALAHLQSGALVALLPLISPAPVKAQTDLYRYNMADTLVEKITAPIFLSAKLVHFDSSFIRTQPNGNSQFKIGKVCKDVGCVGSFYETGKTQAGWWIVENKIIICFLTAVSNGTFNADLRIWKYDTETKKFHLIM